MRKRRKISLQTIEEDSMHAILKARGDIDIILQEEGFTPIVFGSRSPIGLWRVLVRHFNIFSLRWKIRKTDTVFLQFPWIHNNKKKFYNNLFKSGATVNCVIHDLDSFRLIGSIAQHKDELKQLNRCHTIIAHTRAMAKYLTDRGVDKDKIRLLYTFPYITCDAVHTLRPSGTSTVVFAGNLAKSPFINHLANIAGPNLIFNLYGNGIENFSINKYVQYQGIFNPDHPGCIEGNWGLVWDGDRLDTCNGTYGSYLRLNASHKISLYLSLGIPVILWEESSLKEFVEEHKIGITVNSLCNLEETLNNMPLEKLKEIQEQTRLFAMQIRKGERLRSLLSEMD